MLHDANTSPDHDIPLVRDAAKLRKFIAHVNPDPLAYCGWRAPRAFTNLAISDGRTLDLRRPESTAEVIELSDVATALARICRFTGHTEDFYSVAQHSVLVSYLVPTGIALQALLHDAAEAYIGDISSPMRAMLGATYLGSLEYRLLDLIYERIGRKRPKNDARVQVADDLALCWEMRDQLDRVPPPEIAHLMPDERLEGMEWQHARTLFLERLNELLDREPPAGAAVPKPVNPPRDLLAAAVAS